MRVNTRKTHTREDHSRDSLRSRVATRTGKYVQIDCDYQPKSYYGNRMKYTINKIGVNRPYYFSPAKKTLKDMADIIGNLDRFQIFGTRAETLYELKVAADKIVRNHSDKRANANFVQRLIYKIDDAFHKLFSCPTYAQQIETLNKRIQLAR